MTTAVGITNDQVTCLALCFRTLEWSRDQVVLFLLNGWQVERISHLTGQGADEAIAALVEAIAAWATPKDEPPPADDADWADLAPVDRPEAPALLDQRTAIEALMTQLAWHPQHRENHLRKHYNVDQVRHLTVAQAEAALLDLTARVALLPQGGPQ